VFCWRGEGEKLIFLEMFRLFSRNYGLRIPVLAYRSCSSSRSTSGVITPSVALTAAVVGFPGASSPKNPASPYLRSRELLKVNWIGMGRAWVSVRACVVMVLCLARVGVGKGPPTRVRTHGRRRKQVKSSSLYQHRNAYNMEQTMGEIFIDASTSTKPAFHTREVHP
jgi:hypothetical protein